MYIINQGQAAAALSLPTTNGLTRNIFTVAGGLPNAGNQLNLPMPGSNRLSGQPFTIRAAGYVTLPAGTVTTANTPLQYVLYGSNSATFTASISNVLYSSSAVSIFTYTSASPTILPWEFECLFIGANGSTLQSMIGQGRSLVSDPNANVTVQNPPQAITPNQIGQIVNFNAEPAYQFAVGVSVNNVTSTSNVIPVGSIATLTEFGILS